MTAGVHSEDGYYAVIPEWILDADISAQAVRLYAVLRRYADQASMQAHPSRKTLAGRLHVADPKVVDRALADLQRIGAVETFPRIRAGGDRDSNGYLIKRQPPGGGGVSTMTPRSEREGVVVENGRGGGPEATRGGGPKGRGTTAIRTTELHTPEHSPTTTTPTFEDFYTAYPRKEARRRAEQAWRTALKRTDATTIMTGLTHFRFSDQPQFVPLPASWLNGDRWADRTTPNTATNGALRPWEL